LASKAENDERETKSRQRRRLCQIRAATPPRQGLKDYRPWLFETEARITQNEAKMK
jgi:hypothetical protein